MAKIRLSVGLERILIRKQNMTFDEWWKQMKPAECDEVKPYFEEAWRVASASATDAVLKKHAPKARELTRCGTGGLHDEQQYCFEKGWKEGIAAFRKAMRSNV